MRYLAIDHGQKRTGLAVCDASETLVSPHSVIETQNDSVLLERIVSVIEDEGIKAVVMGLPFNMDGTEGARAGKVREFARVLSGTIHIPVLFHDERLSSFEAENLAVALELTRKKKKKRLDAIAAAEILNGFLDAKKNRLAFPGLTVRPQLQEVKIMAHVKPHIRRVENSDQLDQEVLSRFTVSAQKAIDTQGVFCVAISGGQTPAAFYKLLSDKAPDSQIEWGKVHFFWADERCVPPGDEASNFGLADRTFLRTLPIPHENIHRVKGENANPAESALEYEQVLKQFFGLAPGQMPQFDWVMLGLGTDGHIASLLPNTDALFETRKMVCAVYPPKGALSRITLTIPVIQQASEIVMMVSGQAKAEIVRRVFQSKPDGMKYPIHSLWPVMQKITWMIDRQAASLIP